MTTNRYVTLRTPDGYSSVGVKDGSIATPLLNLWRFFHALHLHDAAETNLLRFMHDGTFFNAVFGGASGQLAYDESQGDQRRIEPVTLNFTTSTDDFESWFSIACWKVTQVIRVQETDLEQRTNVAYMLAIDDDPRVTTWFNHLITDTLVVGTFNYYYAILPSQDAVAEAINRTFNYGTVTFGDLPDPQLSIALTETQWTGALARPLEAVQTIIVPDNPSQDDSLKFLTHSNPMDESAFVRVRVPHTTVDCLIKNGSDLQHAKEIARRCSVYLRGLPDGAVTPDDPRWENLSPDKIGEVAMFPGARLLGMSPVIVAIHCELRNSADERVSDACVIRIPCMMVGYTGLDPADPDSGTQYYEQLWTFLEPDTDQVAYQLAPISDALQHVSGSGVDTFNCVVHTAPSFVPGSGERFSITDTSTRVSTEQQMRALLSIGEIAPEMTVTIPSEEEVKYYSKLFLGALSQYSDQERNAAIIPLLVDIAGRQEIELRYLTRIMVVTLTTLTKNVPVAMDQLNRLQALSDAEFTSAITSGQISDLSTLATSNQMASIQASLQLLLQNAFLRDGESNNTMLRRINAVLSAQRREQPVATLASVVSLLR